ncbi:MAG: hypothetical protein AAGF97_18570, partial [Planctomycetota bacterium]
MTNIDQFESAFKAADKLRFSFEQIKMRSALVVTDLPREEAERYGARAQRLFRALEQYGPVECRVVSGDEFHTVADIMQMIHDSRATMV